MFGLAPVVEFLAHARADLLGDLARIDGRIHAAVDGEQNIELGEIGFDGRFHIRILQLAGELMPVERGRAMDLAERSGGGGLQIERAEALLPVRSQFGLHAPLDEGGAHRRRIGLQFLQFLGIFRRQHVGNGRHQLGDLHHRPFERAERARQRRRIAGAAAFAAENAPGGDAGGDAAHIGADPRVACGAGGEAVLFRIGHVAAI